MSQRVLHILSGDLWGGKETQVVLQLEALRALGWDAQLLLFNRGETSRRCEAARIPCHYADERRGIFSLLSSAAHICRLCAPSLLVAHGYKEGLIAWLLARRLDMPWIATIHGALEPHNQFRQLKAFVYFLLYRLCARYSAAKIITVSRSLARELGFSALAKLEIVNNVAKFSRDQSTGERQSFVFQRPAIISVSRLVPIKRIDLALLAFEQLVREQREKQMPLAHFYVIGDGPDRDRLEQQAAILACRQHVHLLGFQQNASALIAQADVLLIASDNEGIPTVLLESIAHAVPVVCTDVGGIREVVELIPGYPAWLVPPNNKSDLASALASVLGLGHTAIDRTGIAAAFSQHFAPEVAAKRLGEIYQKLLP